MRCATLLAEEPPRPPRLAFLETPAWPHAEDRAKAAIRGFASDLGAHCTEESLPSPFENITELHLTVMGVEDLHYYGKFLEETPELLSDKLRGRLEDAREIRGNDYLAALNAREVIYSDFEKLLERYDAVLCLASAGPAPKGFETTGTAIFNGLWTYLGVSCVTLPLLQVDGMPMGVQLVGLRGDEGRLLRTARWLDRTHCRG